MSGLDGSSAAASGLPCQVCGRGPTALVSVSRNLGMLILRRSWSFRASLCRDHGSQLARNWLLATFLMGWWGIISFFVNFRSIAADLSALRAARRLPPAGSVPTGGFGTASVASPAALPKVSAVQMGLVAAIILGVVIVAFVRATFGPKPVNGLAVGDCFDAPSTAGEITDVPHRPCSMAHTAEVFDLVTYSGEQSGRFPTDAEFQAFASNQCGPAFDAYTGGGGGLAATVDVFYMSPTPNGWASGDRTLICYLEAPGGETLSQSLRATTH